MVEQRNKKMVLYQAVPTLNTKDEDDAISPTGVR
jgi:hypothetical protein